MEPRRFGGRFRASRKTQEYVYAVLIVLAGTFFLRLLFSSVVSEPVIGSATVPAAELDGRVRVFDMNQLKSTPDMSGNTEKVLILTPLAKFYPEYWQNLLKLTYPRPRTELGFIVPNNDAGDTVLEQLTAEIKKVQAGPESERFAKVHLLRQDTDSPQSQLEAERHAMKNQKERRKLQSLARNSLLFTTLAHDTAWVLWLDGDIVETPPTLLQDMARHNKDVLVANCWQRFVDTDGTEKTRAYDYNSWVDSEHARQIGDSLGPDDILLEGYAEMATYRTLMAHLHSPSGSPSDEMELDGVGATALLVKADVHRDGAMFPPFPFYHLIESEGFAKMAKRLGYQIFGLPNYLVYHYNE